MESDLHNRGAEEQTKVVRFLKLTGLWSEAYARGETWVRSRLADLKIDLHLVTEYGEEEGNKQVDEILNQIQILESTLRSSPFDPVRGEGALSIQSAAADLAQFALCIVQQQAPKKNGEFPAILHAAKQFLETDDARHEAHSCMARILDRPDVLFEDVGEVVDRAKRLLETLSVSPLVLPSQHAQ